MTIELEVITREGEGERRPTPLLFVHGAWHGAWCWDEHFLPWFAARGWTSVAPSLRGHGASGGREGLRWWRIADYVADVERIAASLERPPVVIGHSMGGFTVQKMLERRDLPGAVLLASAPSKGVLRTALGMARTNPIGFARANLTMSLYPLVETPELARHAFFSASMPEAEVERHHTRLQDESFRGFLDMLGFGLPKPRHVDFPMLALGAADDAVFTVEEVRQTAEAWGASCEIVDDLAHDVMLEPRWEVVAETMAAWLRANGF